MAIPKSLIEDADNVIRAIEVHVINIIRERELGTFPEIVEQQQHSRDALAKALIRQLVPFRLTEAELDRAVAKRR